MDNEFLAKFNTSSFYLAVLFHLFVIALFMLVVSIENQVQTDKSATIMQAAIVQELPSVNKEEMLAQTTAKVLSRAEQKRLAFAKKQAERLEQQEKKKYLAAVAKQMVLTAIAEKKAALLHEKEKVRKEQENLNLSKAPATKENATATQALKNLVEQKKNFQGTAQATSFWPAESDT